MVEWTPQNDLLGDPRVRAFVTHGGLNSIYEVGAEVVHFPLSPVQGGWVLHASVSQETQDMRAVHLPLGS